MVLPRDLEQVFPRCSITEADDVMQHVSGMTPKTSKMIPNLMLWILAMMHVRYDSMSIWRPRPTVDGGMHVELRIQ